jgi:hypothetical protein
VVVVIVVILVVDVGGNGESRELVKEEMSLWGVLGAESMKVYIYTSRIGIVDRLGSSGSSVIVSSSGLPPR